jgi:small subunit ribosomal protein S13
MPRIAGVDIPENKRLEIALRYVYGIGPTNAVGVLTKAGFTGNEKVSELSPAELSRLQKVVDGMKVEGDLRKEVNQNVARLREIGAYRGIRHARGLPVWGQRTRTNARTKRGKRVTIGALKKEVLSKVEASKAEKAKKEAK